jgi:hypothetical protein
MNAGKIKGIGDAWGKVEEAVAEIRKDPALWEAVSSPGPAGYSQETVSNSRVVAYNAALDGVVAAVERARIYAGVGP